MAVDGLVNMYQCPITFKVDSTGLYWVLTVHWVEACVWMAFQKRFWITKHVNHFSTCVNACMTTKLYRIPHHGCEAACCSGLGVTLKACVFPPEGRWNVNKWPTSPYPGGMSKKDQYQSIRPFFGMIFDSPNFANHRDFSSKKRDKIALGLNVTLHTH